MMPAIYLSTCLCIYQCKFIKLATPDTLDTPGKGTFGHKQISGQLTSATFALLHHLPPTLSASLRETSWQYRALQGKHK